MSGDLILYFSRAGENYYEGDLKVVEKGNTEVVADYIKEITNGDVFKVEPEIPYPEDNNHLRLVGKVTSEKRFSHEIYGV